MLFFRTSYDTDVIVQLDILYMIKKSNFTTCSGATAGLSRSSRINSIPGRASYSALGQFED